MGDLRSSSKMTFNHDKVSLESISTGCLQRIADSLEKIERPYEKLIADYEYIKKRNQRLIDENERLTRQVRAYKGWLTRLKPDKPKP